MNKFVLSLVCGGALMALAGCGKEETKTTEVATEVAVADSTPVAVETRVVEEKGEATEVAVTDAVVVEGAPVTVTEIETSTKKHDEKF